ncbi:MAG: hypothetical protein D6732_26240 [Methanobacteriota archaeon]|nr:MAG: hypothetical protein D6732_26240 [Euryarchaeota archaeon]
MTSQMKAAVYTGVPTLEIRDIDIPQPSSQDILVKIMACGVCHTDEGYLEGVPTFKKPPIILGHEPSGYVVEVGENVSGFTEGDRVLIPPVLTCGSCFACRNGRETLCQNQQMLGNHIDGAFAEYVAVPARDIVKLPLRLPLIESAIIADAIATPYHAVFNRAQVTPGDIAVVIGCGGVGINVVQMLSVAGATVVAIDLQDDKLELAQKLGAHVTINPQNDDPKTVLKSSFSRVDVVFEVVGNPKTQQMGYDLLSAGGKLVLVGYSPKKWDGFNSGKVMFRELEVLGSLGCPPRDFSRVIHLVKEGKVKLEPLVTSRYPLEKINEAFHELRGGRGIRTVVTIGDH